MSDIKKTIVVAGNYRCGTTWLAEMLCRGLGYKLAFEPIRSYFPIVHRAIGDQWRPYITDATAKPKHEELFEKFLDGSICKYAELNRTNCSEVLKAEAIVVKFVRATMSLRWMCDTFPIRHAYLITRHPYTATASQVRKNAGPGTPKDMKQLWRFQQEHPEINFARIPRKTDIHWFALWYAVSYYAAFSTTEPHPWTFVKYENLCTDIKNCDALFEPLGEKLVEDYNPRKLSMTSGDWSTGEPTPWSGTITLEQVEEIKSVLQHFPGLMGNLGYEL
jgi:hypothetical protein